MLSEFLSFELRQQLRRPLLYIVSAASFLLLFLSVVQENLTVGMANNGLYANAPISIMISCIVISLTFGLFVGLANGNGAALRDLNENFHSILYSYPLRKGHYYWGRLLSAWLLTLIPLAAGMLGLAVGTLMPFAPAQDIGPTHLAAYLHAFVLIIVPNSFILAGLSYTLAMRFRSTTAGFVGTVFMLLLYMMGGRLVLQSEQGLWAALVDPIGFNTLMETTRYWTLSERNTLPLVADGLLLLNRALWLGLTLAVLVWQYLRFSFSYALTKKLRKRKAAVVVQPAAEAPEPFQGPLTLPRITFAANLRTRWAQLWAMVGMDLRGLLRGRIFWILVLMGIFNGLNALAQADGWYNTASYPITYIMIDALHGGFELFMFALVIYYAGDVVWRERDHHFAGITDAMPFSNTGRVAAKVISLLLMVFMFQALGITLGILTQLSRGYAHIDLGHYLAEILGIDFLYFAWLVLLSVVLHTLIQHKYLAYGATVAVLLLVSQALPMLGVEAYWLRFAQLPEYTYSDINGFGPYVPALLSYVLYWSAAAGLLWVLAARWWVRGQAAPLRVRLRHTLRGYAPARQLTLAALTLVFLGCGSFIVYQTEVAHESPTQKQQEARQAAYEQQYGQYRTLHQPRVVATHYTVDLYPTRRALQAEARVLVVNRGATPITEVHFTLPAVVETTVSWAAELTHDDEVLGYQVYTLAQPLAPGDTLAYTVHSEYAAQGMQDRAILTQLVENGTFLTNMDLVPQIGYQPRRELTEAEDRAKHGLPEKSPLPHPGEATAYDLHQNYVTGAADWVQVSATVSTEADQVAIAPGALVEQWTENGRAYYRYQTPQPTLNFVNFASGRYTVARDTWQGEGHSPVALEVYYHPAHGYNVDRMLEALAAGLDYYTAAFGPYPHGEARIIEFPRYGDYAQAFPGTMPYSESVGFITDLSDSTEIDQVYFVVAHELAHQWWAHQVIGARTAGSTFMSETFAQYSALMVMEHTYGPERMKQFLAEERDRYLRGRSNDPLPEQPLLYNQDQSYIHYRKGSVLMYALRDYVGEAAINRALRNYLQAHAHNTGAYSTALDALAALRAETPDSLQYLLDDMLTDITLYELRTAEATMEETGDDTYTVTLTLEAAKLRADAQGQESPMPLNDWIDVGVYPKATDADPYPTPLALHRLRLRGDTTLTLQVVGQPHRAGIDPNHLLIDRDPEDNVRKVQR